PVEDGHLPPPGEGALGDGPPDELRPAQHQKLHEETMPAVRSVRNACTLKAEHAQRPAPAWACVGRGLASGPKVARHRHHRRGGTRDQLGQGPPVHGQMSGSKTGSPSRTFALSASSFLIQRAGTRVESSPAPACRSDRAADWACPPLAQMSSKRSTWDLGGRATSTVKCSALIARASDGLAAALSRSREPIRSRSGESGALPAAPALMAWMPSE